MKPHHVLDNATADQKRNSLSHKLLVGNYIKHALFGCGAAAIAVAIYFLEQGLLPDGYVEWGSLLFFGLFVFHLARFIEAPDVDGLEPLNDPDALITLDELADKHPEVSRFVSEAIKEGKTLRWRDYHAALRVDRMEKDEKFLEELKAQAPANKARIDEIKEKLREKYASEKVADTSMESGS